MPQRDAELEFILGVSYNFGALTPVELKHQRVSLVSQAREFILAVITNVGT